MPRFLFLSFPFSHYNSLFSFFLFVQTQTKSDGLRHDLESFLSKYADEKAASARSVPHCTVLYRAVLYCAAQFCNSILLFSVSYIDSSSFSTFSSSSSSDNRYNHFDSCLLPPFGVCVCNRSFAQALLDRIHTRGLEMSAMIGAGEAHCLADDSRLSVDTQAILKGTSPSYYFL